MEGLWRALDPCTPEEREAFAAAGIHDGKRFQAAYPLAAYMRVVEACARSRFPGQDELSQYTAIGRLFTQGFVKTVGGRALVGLLRVIGPRRTLERMTRNFRTANNYAEASLETLSPSHHRVRCRHVQYPGFYRGLILEGLERAGAKDLSVDYVGREGDEVVYDVRWR